MRENMDQKKIPYLDTFYSVSIIGSSLEIKELNGQKYLLGKAKVLYRNEKDSCECAQIAQLHRRFYPVIRRYQDLCSED